MPNEKPRFTIFDSKSDIAEKFDFYIKIVIGILMVAVLTMLFMVGGLLLDAWHFNSATYKEYSEKTQSVDQMQKSNGILLQQIDAQQKQITQLQQQVDALLKSSAK